MIIPKNSLFNLFILNFYVGSIAKNSCWDEEFSDTICKSISKSIFDELYDSDEDMKVNNKNQDSEKNPALKLINDDEEEGSYKSSLDLFPEEPSLEDDHLPSSSGGSQEVIEYVIFLLYSFYFLVCVIYAVDFLKSANYSPQICIINHLF